MQLTSVEYLWSGKRKRTETKHMAFNTFGLTSRLIAPFQFLRAIYPLQKQNVDLVLLIISLLFDPFFT